MTILPRSTSITPIPEVIVHVVQAAFPKNNTLMLMRDTLGSVFSDQDFAGLFPHRGQPAMSLKPRKVQLLPMLTALIRVSILS